MRSLAHAARRRQTPTRGTVMPHPTVHLPLTMAGGQLLITAAPGRPLTIRLVGITEAETIASHYLAERVRPQLNALDAAIQALGQAVRQ